MAQYDQTGQKYGLPVPPLKTAQPKAPKPTPTSLASAPASTQAASDVPPSYESDPILQQINALAAQNVAAAEASAAAARTQALIRFGYSPEMAGLYDSNTAAAAAQNPFSTLAQLAHQHQLRAQGLDENLNKGNLFYSSYRGKQLGEEGRQYLGEQAGAQSSLQDLLGNISQGLLNAKSGAQQSIISGEQAAAGRATDFGLKYGTGGGGAAAGAPGTALLQAVQASANRAGSRTDLLRRAALRGAAPRPVSMAGRGRVA